MSERGEKYTFKYVSHIEQEMAGKEHLTKDSKKNIFICMLTQYPH